MSEGGTGNGIAFAFSGAAKKPTRKLDLHEREEGPKKDVLTGIGADGGLQSAEEQAAPSGPKIIPKQANTYRSVSEYLFRRTQLYFSNFPSHLFGAYCHLCDSDVSSHAFRSAKPAYVPSYIPEGGEDNVVAQGIDNFQAAEHDTADAQQDVTYGLIKRTREPSDGDGPAGTSARPPSEAEQLKLDLEQLPPEASLEAYEEMPVESFGEALLRGMGWSEGRAIGRGNKKEVLAQDLVRRPHRLGLGAAPAPAPETHKKYIKPGENANKMCDSISPWVFLDRLIGE